MTELDEKIAGIGIARTGNRFTVLFANLSEPSELAALLIEERRKLMEQIKQPCALGGLEMTHQFAQLMDAVIARMFIVACTRQGVKAANLAIAVVATGGYGRGELSPYSDIDITFIPYRDGDPQIDRVIREMFTQLMDICISKCGLEVGYAYRLREDCASLDHQTICGLLDARLIIGNERLFIQFEDVFWTSFNAADFIFAKLDERRASLKKHGTTPRVVEPQLKEGPGGLRDLHTAVWITQANGMLPAARVRGQRAMNILHREANVLSADIDRLTLAKERLLRVRNLLHAITGAERDHLVITRQEEVADLLGYRSLGSLPEESTPPVELFMSDLYEDMAVLRRTAGQVMRRIENSRQILGIGLDCEHKEIVPANDALANDGAEWMLWACEMAQKYNLVFSEELEQNVVALLEEDPELTDNHAAGRVFTRIISKPGKILDILQPMADLGILGWFLPEFGRLMNLIPYDPSHDHTVGQHSLYVIKNLEDLLRGDLTEEQAEMHRIMMELPHPEYLFMAALLHDSGKAFPGRPHSEVSEELVTEVCNRIGWSREAADSVRFLARHHLVMAETSRLRDINLEETIRDFTAVVDDLDSLNMLYLLTYADTRAVGEGVWTQVKGRFLRDLWRRTAAVLSDEEPVRYDDASIARARRRLLKDLSLENLPENEVGEHVQAMPPYYLLNHSLTQIALHINFVRQVREGHSVVDFSDEPESTFTEMTVCTFDDPQPGLLAKIAGVLYACDIDVHSTQVMTRVTERDRIALDTLLIDYRGRQLSSGKRREISNHLIAVLKGETFVKEILRKKKHSFRPQARHASQNIPAWTVQSIRNDLSDSLTVVEISGTNLHGALYEACEALSSLGWDIRSARVSIWHGQALASFYVAGARVLSEHDARSVLTAALPAVSTEV